MRFRKHIGWLFVVIGVWAGYALSADLLIIFGRWLDSETGLARLWVWAITMFAPLLTFSCAVALGVWIREVWLEVTLPPAVRVSQELGPQDPEQR